MPVVASDGSGGAIIAWYDFATDPLGDIVAQRIGGDGRLRWRGPGAAICREPGGQRAPIIVPDAAGGAIVVWGDDPRGGDARRIRAQRVDSLGRALWGDSGVTVATGRGGMPLPTMTTDDAGGGLITWVGYDADPRGDIYAQRLDARGRARWGRRGRAVCAAGGAQQFPFVPADGRRGAYVGWVDRRRDLRVPANPGSEIYIQHLDSTGTRLWADQGVSACRATGERFYPSLVSSGYGCATAVWVDRRSGSYSDVFGALLSQAGALAH